MIGKWESHITIILILHIASFKMRGYLNEEDISTFYRQGYVVKRNCVGPDEVDALASVIDEILASSTSEIKATNTKHSEMVYSDSDQIMHIKGARVVYKQASRDSDVTIVRVNGVSGFSSAILKTMRSDKLCHTFLELLKCSEVEHIINQMHPKLPNDGVVYHKHKDIQFRRDFDPMWRDVLSNGSGSYAICILAIDSMSRENGGLFIDPSTFNPTAPAAAKNTLEDDLVWVSAQPGDLLFMHPHLDHGSHPNTACCPRRTLLSGFCAMGANTKAYPGTDVNDIISAEGDVIRVRPADWKKNSVESKMTAFH